MSSAATKKGMGLEFKIPAAGESAAPPIATPFTGVGQAMATAQTVHQLRAQVQQLEAERGAQPLDPKTIRPSRWANRHADSFTGQEFDAFKAEIADAGGNVQPIKVRPLSDGLTPDGARYELVFGHRRHRACLDLGLPVLAVVQELDEQALWAEMERENRARANLSAWEQGMMYRRALDAGLFPTQIMLAKAIGRGPTDVSEALRIASLPEEVIAAFPSPNDIQFRWAKPLTDALRRDQNGVLAVAAELAARKPSAAEAFAALTRTPEPSEIRPSYLPQRVDLGGKARAEIRNDGRELTVKFDAALNSAQWAELEKALRRITKGNAK